MPSLSFIVPAYNVVAFIDEMLDSLMVQTVADFEAIIVDDGSTDGTAERVAALAARDARFRLVKGPGQGPGVARNLALDLARGEILAFIDADDVIHPRYIELITQARATLSDDEVLVLPYVRGSTPQWPATVSGRLHPHRALDVAVQGKAVWRLSLARSFLERHGIRFLPLRNYEDAVTTTSIIKHARRFVRLHSPLYFYRQRPGSLIRRRGPERVKDALEAIAALTTIRNSLPSGMSPMLTDLARIKIIVSQYRLLPREEQRPFLGRAFADAGLSRHRALCQALELCLFSRGIWLRPTLRFSADAVIAH